MNARMTKALVFHGRSSRSAMGVLGLLLYMPFGMVAYADQQVGEMLDLQSQTTRQGQVHPRPGGSARR